MKKLILDVTSVVRFLGGRGELYRKISAAGIELNHRTIDNWIHHRTIPMNRFIELVAIAKANGLKLKLEDHLKYEN